jgi:hypothetical protein
MNYKSLEDQFIYSITLCFADLASPKWISEGEELRESEEGE